MHEHCYVATQQCCTVHEISDLNDRLTGLQHTKDQDRDMFEHQLQQLRNEYEETKDRLMSENMTLSMCISLLVAVFIII